ncbi:hypothetical protein SBOR_9651 [Sclerotinia borealis F-4128]|uniref:AB hydrolase-1 domain-containing protein n=1 Tax=Sclerotinia borealis (strain F-4128) TaxID=1432307 RepID=W9C244_SCLBF|nr:hypothetical protein SBOR_9651 [Sclerotinia borealis F-4128]
MVSLDTTRHSTLHAARRGYQYADLLVKQLQKREGTTVDLTGAAVKGSTNVTGKFTINEWCLLSLFLQERLKSSPNSCSMQIEITHQPIQLIRTNPRSPLGRCFDNIVYVSHSYAGWLGTDLAVAYPKDVNAMVLTSWSTAVNFTPFASTELEPVSILDPRKFPKLQLGCIAVKTQSNRTSLFYASDYSQQVAAYDFATADTWTIGETGNLGFVLPPVNYTGPLYIATGVEDKLFCQPPIAACQTILKDTQQFFPGVERFGFTAVENTGHTLMLHKSAQQTFAKIHTFLDAFL